MGCSSNGSGQLTTTALGVPSNMIFKPCHAIPGCQFPHLFFRSWSNSSSHQFQLLLYASSASSLCIEHYFSFELGTFSCPFPLLVVGVNSYLFGRNYLCPQRKENMVRWQYICQHVKIITTIIKKLILESQFKTTFWCFSSFYVSDLINLIMDLSVFSIDLHVCENSPGKYNSVV